MKTRTTDRAVYPAQLLCVVVFVSAAIFALVRSLWYFYHWNLPMWEWIGAVLVAPITFIAIPFYVGHTENDWSLVAAAVLAVISVWSYTLLDDRPS